MRSVAALLPLAVVSFSGSVFAQDAIRTGNELNVEYELGDELSTPDLSSKEKSGKRMIFTFGYGRLSTPGVEFGSPREHWGAAIPGVGFGWRGGEGQVILEIVFTGKRDRVSTSGWGDREYEEFYVGFMPKFRHRLYRRVFGSFGFGFIGEYHSGGLLGTSNDDFPAWSIGADIEVLTMGKTRMLAGLQTLQVLGHGDHDAPDWSLLSLHLTWIVAR